MKSKVLLLVLVIALVLTVAGVVLASNGVGFSRWVVSGGATQAGGNQTVTNATLGQPIVGVTSQDNITLGQGYWHEVYVKFVYLPLVKR